MDLLEARRGSRGLERGPGLGGRMRRCFGKLSLGCFSKVLVCFAGVLVFWCVFVGFLQFLKEAFQSRKGLAKELRCLG